MDQRRVE